LLQHAAALFAGSASKPAASDHETLQAQLYEQIGRLKIELDWVKNQSAGLC
jgi:hypothetical protein